MAEQASIPMEDKSDSGNASSFSDIDLVKNTLSGDRLAYRELVEKYQQRVYSIAFGVLHNREDSLDVCQDVFIKAYRKLAKFRGASSFYTWLYRIALNMAIDYRRRRKVAVEVEYDDAIAPDDEGEKPGMKSPNETPSETLDRKEINKLVMEAIQTLPDEQKAVLVLREIEGLAYDEIAKVAGISIGTVMSRLHYGRRKLREILEPHISGSIK
jgi:RNA polymerase sigma-70 factor, ECF subfamily